jgi:hypothetical protein
MMTFSLSLFKKKEAYEITLLCLAQTPLLGNGSVYTSPRQRIHMQ